MVLGISLGLLGFRDLRVQGFGALGLLGLGAFRIEGPRL